MIEFDKKGFQSHLIQPYAQSTATQTLDQFAENLVQSGFEDLLATTLRMHPCIQLAFFAAIVNFQFIFRLLTIRISSYFFADLLSRQSVPILHCCMGLCCPSCSTFPLFLFNFPSLLLSLLVYMPLNSSAALQCINHYPNHTKHVFNLIVQVVKMLTVSLQASIPEEHYVGFELLTTTFFSTLWKLQVFYPHITTYGIIYCC